jgi:ribosomal protein L9
MSKTAPSWQSTVIALALIALVGGIFIVVFEKEGTGEALKVWGALGTLVGVLVGAVPTYFFGQQAAAVAKEASKTAQETVEEERQKRQEAEESARDAELKAKTVLAVADSTTVAKAREIRGDLFG